MPDDAAPPPLAGSSGSYREYRPPPALRGSFLCLWSHAVPGGSEVAFSVVPDGCVDLVWIDGRLTVAGPDRTAALTTLRPGTAVLGARFRPGAAAAWLGLPMSEIVGCRLALDEVTTIDAAPLAARIGDAAAPLARLRLLADGLASLAPDAGPADPAMALAFAWLGRGEHARVTAALCERLGTSERSLRRRCHESFGYGPKTLDRILRFQRFLALARRAGGDGLAGLAAAAGYADQPHLTREVRALAGRTPAEILRQYRG